MPSPAFSSESGLESDALHINSSCASSGGATPSAGRLLYSLPSGLAHHYSALQASMSSGDNFIQGRNLSLSNSHGLLPLVSRGHDGMPGSRVWTSFQVLPSTCSMGQQSGVSVQGSHDMTAMAARHSDKMEANPGAGGVEEHGSNNEHGGASFAEHDYMSDVSSAPAEEKCTERERAEGCKGEDAQDTDSNLNLRETELRLGPPESSSGEGKNALLSGAKRGFSEAIGSLSECKRTLSEAAAACVAESKRGGFPEAVGINGHSVGEQGVGGGKLSEHRARNLGYSDARGSMVLPVSNPSSMFADVRSSYLDSRAGLFEHQGVFFQPKAAGDGDGKGASQQQAKQLGAGCAPTGFRIPSLPPPWQALDQSAASLGPFPSSKVSMDGGSSLGKASSGDDASCRNAPVVGWPPVRGFRKGTLSPPTPPPKACAESPAAVTAASAPAAAPAPAAAASGVSSPQPRPVPEGMTKVMRPSAGATAGAAGSENGCRGNGGGGGASPNPVTLNYWFVKVYMDGVPFGRKVDLRIHGCYEKLSVGLEDMFTRYANVEQGSNGESKPLKFLQGSDYVLTYEDQDGDLMLVGDVPWNMFITSVKRLRIMKSSEAVGIAPRNSPKLWKGGAT